MAVLRFGRKKILPVWLTYLALFSRINFSAWSGHCKEVKLKGNLPDCPQILTVGRLTPEQQKFVCRYFLSKYFSMRAIFVQTLHIYLITIWKTFHNFLLYTARYTWYIDSITSRCSGKEYTGHERAAEIEPTWYTAKRRHVFGALWVRKLIKLAKGKVRFDF